jgi:hypothetical protein
MKFWIIYALGVDVTEETADWRWTVGSRKEGSLEGRNSITA